jgi:putative endonuclease
MGRDAETGRRGEDAAARHLIRRGWRIVARRWRGGGGELDLVAVRRGVVAVCEVKTRGDPAALAEPLTAAQRRRITAAATALLAARPDLAAREARLDVLLVHPRWPWARVRHLRGAILPRADGYSAAASRKDGYATDWKERR